MIFLCQVSYCEVIPTILWDGHRKNALPRWVNEYDNAEVILSHGKKLWINDFVRELVFLVMARRCEICFTRMISSDWAAVYLAIYLLHSTNSYAEQFLKFAKWIIRCVYCIIFRAEVMHCSPLQIAKKQFAPEQLHDNSVTDTLRWYNSKSHASKSQDLSLFAERCLNFMTCMDINVSHFCSLSNISSNVYLSSLIARKVSVNHSWN